MVHAIWETISDRVINGASRQTLLLENARLREHCADIAADLARFDLLAREADHRIKNSLQVVASLLGVQASREEAGVARDALISAAARIHAIAGIHDALQKISGDSLVDLGEIVEALCRRLHEMAGGGGAVSVIVAAGKIEAPAALAQPVALAVNELVINALRHAFPDNRPGSVHVTLYRDGDDLRLVVADDGKGLPDDLDENRGYGMKLVRMVAVQIGGVLSFDTSAGTRVELRAPLSAKAEAA
ncbi:MAG: sensor histidine kinase [Parvularculaceae bacterium]